MRRVSREDCDPQTVGAGDTREDHKQSGTEFVSRLTILSTFLKAFQTFGILWEHLIDNSLTVPTAEETGLLCEMATVPGLHMATNTCGVATLPSERAQKTPALVSPHRIFAAGPMFLNSVSRAPSWPCVHEGWAPHGRRQRLGRPHTAC